MHVYGTALALVFIPAMSRRYPAAQTWVAPGVWSVPVDLPLSWLGINAAGREGRETH